MEQDIIDKLNQPKELEKLYRKNEREFTNAFNTIYSEINTNPLAQAWNERLNYEPESTAVMDRKEISYLIIAVIIAGFIAKIPKLFSLSDELFYSRNLAFIVFPALIGYFVLKQKLTTKQIALIVGLLIISIFYINLIPSKLNSDTLILAGIHLPLFLWSVFGFSFVGATFKSLTKRISFLKFNGDWLVLSAILLLACALLTAITFGLFKLINVNIEYFFTNFALIWGLPAIPILATYLVQSNPQLVNKISPVIAKIFVPIVLLMLSVYLIAMVGSVKKLYTDRDFLITFNALLIGVLALIFFSIAETSNRAKTKIEQISLLGLSLVTIIVNGFALSAILIRIFEWGFTPNRTAVLGSNLLILTNLIWVSLELIKSWKAKQNLDSVENSIAYFLPIYSIWTALVTFVFPALFGFN